MGVKVATTCLHNWSQPPIVPQSPPSSSQILPSAISSPSSNRRSRHCCHSGGPPAPIFRYVHRSDRSSSAALFFANSPSTSRQLLHRSLSSSNSECYTKQQRMMRRTVKRACSSTASFDAFSDEDFSRKIQELALRFQLSSSSSNHDGGDDQQKEEDVQDHHHHHDAETETVVVVSDNSTDSSSSSYMMMGSPNNINEDRPLLWELAAAGNQVAAPEEEWPQEEILPPANIIERKANSVNLPVSLRIIQRKMQWQEGFREAGESAYCSVKKAFSSMVFIIQELQSFTLQMREVQLCYEDLQGILVRVQKEMHASFVWLFQQIFSHTPTLMVYVMILLANFTVYSMSSSNAAAAIAAAAAPPVLAAETTSMVQILDTQGKEQINNKFDSSSSVVKSYSISSSSSSAGKTNSIGGGNNGGGGKVRPVASGSDGQFQQSDNYRTILPDVGASQLSSFGRTPEESSSVVERDEAEVSLWKSMVDEAGKMQLRVDKEAGSSLDHEARKRLVSPVTAKVEADDDYTDYFKTELVYQSSLANDPNNVLLLANYAQFLFLVAQDYDRAEEYFKKAVAVKPADAEAFNKYASFLWRVRNNLWAAEETYLEAISAEPTNSLYAANYAHFLWNTGGDDTCFPLTSPNQEEEEA